MALKLGSFWWLWLVLPALAQEAPHSDPRKGCVNAKCHASIVRHNKLHGPVTLKECVVCHVPTSSEKHKFEKPSSIATACASCHDPVLHKKVANQHQPVVKGDCLSCHDPHGGATSSFLKQDTNTLCLSCHKAIKPSITTEKFAHDELWQKRLCTDCHLAHEAPRKNLLPMKEGEACFSCHDGIQAQSKASSMQHGPLQKLQCSECHTTHSKNHSFFLRHPYQTANYIAYSPGSYETCFACHSRALVEAADDPKATRFRHGKTNLHFLHVNREEKGRNCNLCHQHHFSSKPHLMRDSFDFGTWEVPLGVQFTEQGGSCQTACHQAYEYSRLGTILEYK